MSGRSKPAEPAASGARRVTLRSGLLAALLAVYVARPLLPSEGAVTADGEGLPFVLILLAIASLWLLGGALQKKLLVRLGWADAAWLALLVCLGLSAFDAVEHRAARPAINLFWEWTGLGLGFFLVRQLVGSRREARAVAAAMVALAAALSAYGLHEYFVSAPQTRALYEKNPERVLREMRIPPDRDSPERLRFENRLQSTEPMATFGLANSLAGVLAPWLIVGLGIGRLSLHEPTPFRGAKGDNWRRPLQLALSALMIALVAACLLLTKSRSAWIATAFGMACLGGEALRRGRRLNWRAIAAGFGLLAALVAATIVAGAFDREILTEASKSLGYRWQYWRSSLAMIADHPWLGCGPGNFQDEYTRYKLPEASEVVADPHNGLLEVWATAGSPALVAVLGIFAGMACDLVRFRRRAVPPLPLGGGRGEGLLVGRGDLTQPDDVAMLLGGGILGGFLLAFFIGLASTVALSLESMIGGLAVMALVVAILYPWIDRGTLPAALPLVAALVLAVNLLAAGGIAFPSVAGSLWLLLALGLSLAGADMPARSLSARATALALGSMLALGCAFLWSDYLPAMNCRLALLRAQTAEKPADQRALLKSAAEADPLSDEPWNQLAAIDRANWESRGNRPAFERWAQAIREVALRRPHWAAARAQAGDTYLQAFRRDRRRDDLAAAIAQYEQAVELYPNRAANHAKLAIALAAAGDADRARQAAAEALRLDELTPHADQKLPAALRGAQQAILSE
jgi:hypothetical protein